MQLSAENRRATHICINYGEIHSFISIKTTRISRDFLFAVDYHFDKAKRMEKFRP